MIKKLTTRAHYIIQTFGVTKLTKILPILLVFFGIEFISYGRKADRKQNERELLTEEKYHQLLHCLHYRILMILSVNNMKITKLSVIILEQQESRNPINSFG